MGKKEFRLATLLRLREATRDERRERLAEAHRTDDELVREMSCLDAERRRVRDECREAVHPGELDVERLAAACRYVSGLHVREERIEQQRETLGVEIENRRQSLVEADRDVQILEKLEERQIRQRRLETERLETKTLDEIAMQAVASRLQPVVQRRAQP